MSSAASPPTGDFAFRGNAVAASGFLTSTSAATESLSPHVVTVHGESSLPVIGGISQSFVRRPGLLFRRNIEYGQCETFAAGGGGATSKVTVVASAVADVRVTASPSPGELDGFASVSFRASRLSIAIRAIHPRDTDAEFDLLGDPETDGLSLIRTPLRGRPETIPLRLEFDRELLRSRTWSALHKSGAAAERMSRQRNGYSTGSIVQAIYRGDRRIEGYILRERGLGTIYFGEIILNDHNRRITLVRIRTGSFPEGEMAFASADPNGIWR